MSGLLSGAPRSAAGSPPAAPRLYWHGVQHIGLLVRQMLAQTRVSNPGVDLPPLSWGDPKGHHLISGSRCHTSSPPHKKLVCCRSLFGNDNIPNIFVDSHIKRPELRGSYQLQKSRSALILLFAAQALRCEGGALILASGKWVRASARKNVFGSRLRQAKCSACPTYGWVKSLPHHCRHLSRSRRLSVLRGKTMFFLLLSSSRRGMGEEGFDYIRNILIIGGKAQYATPVAALDR